MLSDIPSLLKQGNFKKSLLGSERFLALWVLFALALQSEKHNSDQSNFLILVYMFCFSKEFFLERKKQQQKTKNFFSQGSLALPVRFGLSICMPQDTCQWAKVE